MRANYKLQRLYVDTPLLAGAVIPLDKAQTNYLLNVLRMADGDYVLVFNGRDGEWSAMIEKTGKKTAQLVCDVQERAQPDASTLVFCFAPLKSGRLDYMVQKAVEMGAGTLQPVITEYTQNHRLNLEKMQAWVIEAAEQCGVLAIARCKEPVILEALLESWDDKRALIFCDEDHDTHNPLPALRSVQASALAVLVGPEGGFSDDERLALRSRAFVTAIPLGPRVLRADTAAVAALAMIQAELGDWN